VPLVSCIMPTANRRRFVPEAIRLFLAQDYLEKELVILDDGEDSVTLRRHDRRCAPRGFRNGRFRLAVRRSQPRSISARSAGSWPAPAITDHRAQRFGNLHHRIG
jgi:hypothetical protein